MLKINYKIAVSGAANIHCCSSNIIYLASEIGKEIAKQNCILITGATTGVPHYSSIAYKKIGGTSIGFSPASSQKAHVKIYKLPINPFDIIIYTGADYVGRNMIMTKAADGIIIICGRMGTLHEFATAFEIKKPIAVLEKSGAMADKIKMITQNTTREAKKIIYETDPKALVEKLILEIKKEK